MEAIAPPQSFLIFGNGWIGSQFKEILQVQGKKVVISNTQIESREQVMNELTIHKPTRVINTAGVRGTPNADWCEDNKIETFRSNVLGALNVVDCCYQLGIHVTQFGSACIYNLPEKEVRNRAPFTEKEEPFFKGAWYHRSRLLSEQTIGHYPNLLLLRMRIPLAADLHRNNHIARLLRYDKIVDLTGSGTALPNLLPGAIILSENSETGIYNFVTPGELSNVEIMKMAKQYIRPDLRWETFELKEMLATLKAPRAICILDATKLQKKLREYGYEVKERREALEEIFQIMVKRGL